MHSHELQRLASRLLAGEMSLDEFVATLGRPATAELGEATLDLDRPRRCGYPEVVYGEGKSPETLKTIVETLAEHGSDVFATRIAPEQAELLLSAFPRANYNPRARTFRLPIDGAAQTTAGQVAVVSAGTSDLPVAEEACETLDWMGVGRTMICDVGVAGPHRLPAHLDALNACDAVVVVAGMEGALPSVVGGYLACPVIAVPTSVGYGTHFGGLAALLAMLNSCAANVTVVNIDAGFKAAYVAGLIARGKK